MKEEFFHGVHQHLKDSIRFCYKQQETTYEELFPETVEAEKEKVPETKVTSLKAKSAVVSEERVRVRVRGLGLRLGLGLGSSLPLFVGPNPNNPIIVDWLHRRVRIVERETRAHAKDVGPLPVQQDLANRDKSHTSATIVGGGGIVSGNVQVQGASNGGP